MIFDRDDHYGSMADRYGDAHLRDMQASEDRRDKARAKTGYTLSEVGPLARPLTQGWAMYSRFHPGAEYVSVIDDKGREWKLTERQAAVYDLARTYIENGHTRIRDLAKQLGYAPSTVSRALVKLQAIGLIGVLVGRGCYGGVIIFARAANDGLEAFRTRAKAKLAQWRKASDARVSRLISNVATYFSYEEVRSHGYEHVYGDVMNATLIREWSPDELRDAGII